MSYVQSSLLKDEDLLLFTYGHWIAFAKPIVASLVLLGGWYAAPVLLEYVRVTANSPGMVHDYLAGHGISIPEYSRMSPASLKVLAVLFATCLLWFVGAWLKYVSSEFAITDHRVLVKRGLVLRNTSELFLGSVESVHLHQSIGGRLFGYGTLVVIGRGNTQDKLVDVPNPERFRQTLQEQSARMRR